MRGLRLRCASLVLRRLPVQVHRFIWCGKVFAMQMRKSAGEMVSPENLKGMQMVITRRECLHICGWKCAGAFVIDDDDAFRGDRAFGYFEGCGDGSVGEEFFPVPSTTGNIFSQSASTRSCFNRVCTRLALPQTCKSGPLSC